LGGGDDPDREEPPPEHAASMAMLKPAEQAVAQTVRKICIRFLLD
jgi:hypothetical protein